MSDYNPRDVRNTSLKLMGKRLGVTYAPHLPQGSELYGEIFQRKSDKKIRSILESDVVGYENLDVRLENNGGILQNERMIYDKRRSLDRATKYSYQAALIQKVGEEEPYRALINPNKNKVDYDDKIVSVGYEYGLRTGDVFEWLGTGTYWLVYLQDIDEVAYFRGDIRRCSYEISWEDEDGLHSTYAAVRGPVETKIDFIQKHKISIDEPNHSLHILLPRSTENLEYFKRYSKFYLKGESEGSPKICWRVEATDWISTPDILEITAVEYFINKDEDDLEEGLVGSLITDPIDPNNEEDSGIIGETFIKPKITYTYQYKGKRLPSSTKWTLDKNNYPVEVKVDESNRRNITIRWKSNYSGQMVLSYGNCKKTIVVESLF